MTTPVRSGTFPDLATRGDGRPRLIGRIGSLDAFWPLIERVLARLQPRRLCEIGVDQGIFTSRLLAWGQENGCAYVGIDPAPSPEAADRIGRQEQGSPETSANRLIVGRSLEVLPELEPCGAYFIDGDHNYYTVRNELALIARRAEDADGPIIFAHDVGWPFARRDMYHEPGAIPPEECHPHSADLGVSLESDELVRGGLRSQGRYSIALHAGGPRNGVLTAIEDFLEGGAGRGWQSVVVPVAYGLAILYRPDSVSEKCRACLDELRVAVAAMDVFFESCEANFLYLYLYSEGAKSRLDDWARSDQRSQGIFQRMQEEYQNLERAYADLSAHSEGLLKEYRQLLEAYATLDDAFQRLGKDRVALQCRLESSATSSAPSAGMHDDPRPGLGAVTAINPE